jgi:hypothetical protein
MTPEAQLDKLRELSEQCQACRPGEAETVADEHLPNWLRMHGHDPDTLQPGTPAQLMAWRAEYKFVMVIGG